MDAPVTYIPNFVKSGADVLNAIWEETPWIRHSDAPRFECWMNDYGMDYTYGRGAGTRTYQAIRVPTADPNWNSHWTIHAASYRDVIDKKLGHRLEACFMNGYQDGKDHLGWHADDDPKIDHAKPIAVITIGAAREIWLRRNGQSGNEHESVLLEDGSCLLMHPRMQSTHQHRIPKASKPVGARVSFTYRGLIYPKTYELTEIHEADHYPW